MAVHHFFFFFTFIKDLICTWSDQTKLLWLSLTSMAMTSSAGTPLVIFDHKNLRSMPAWSSFLLDLVARNYLSSPLFSTSTSSRLLSARQPSAEDSRAADNLPCCLPCIKNVLKTRFLLDASGHVLAIWKWGCLAAHIDGFVLKYIYTSETRWCLNADL